MACQSQLGATSEGPAGGVLSGTGEGERGMTFSVGQKLQTALPPNHLPNPNQPLWCIVRVQSVPCPVITRDSKRESGNVRSFENFRTLSVPLMTSSHYQNTSEGRRNRCHTSIYSYTASQKIMKTLLRKRKTSMHLDALCAVVPCFQQ